MLNSKTFLRYFYSEHKKNYRFFDILFYFLGLMMIVGLIIFFNNRIDYTGIFNRVSSQSIAFSFIAHLMGSFFISLSQIYMVKSFNVSLGFFESFFLTIVNRAGNLFTPFRAGIAYRAVYFKTRHDMPLMYFGSMFLGFDFILLFTASTVGAILLTFYWMKGQHGLFILMCLLWVGVFLSLILFSLSKNTFQISHGRTSRLFLLLNGIYLLRNNKPSIYISILGNLFTILFYAIAFNFILFDMSLSPTWQSAVLVSSIGGLARLIHIFPSSFGIYEGIIALMGSFLSIPPSVGFSMALLLRLCEILIYAILILPGLIFLNSRKRQNFV